MFRPNKKVLALYPSSKDAGISWSGLSRRIRLAIGGRIDHDKFLSPYISLGLVERSIRWPERFKRTELGDSFLTGASDENTCP